jgi:chorismate mutase
MVGVLGVKKANQKISVETPQNETKVLNRLSKSVEKAF